MSALNLPALRWGKPYESLEVQEISHFITGEPVAKISQINGGMIRRDMRHAAKARNILRDIPVEDLGTSLDRDATLAIGVMGQVVVGSLQTEGSFDQDFFRRGMFRYYACSRGFPMTLDGFKELYGFPTTSSVLTSEVKCIERKLGRDTTLGISYVTLQTLLSSQRPRSSSRTTESMVRSTSWCTERTTG